MGSHRHLGECGDSKENWTSYVGRAKLHFSANVPINACGPATYSAIKDILAPDPPSNVNFDIIVEKLSQHFQPVLNQMALSCRFFS